MEETLFPAGRDVRLKPGEDELYARVRELLKALDLYTPTRAAVLIVMLDESIPHHHRDARGGGAISRRLRHHGRALRAGR